MYTAIRLPKATLARIKRLIENPEEADLWELVGTMRVVVSMEIDIAPCQHSECLEKRAAKTD